MGDGSKRCYIIKAGDMGYCGKQFIIINADLISAIYLSYSGMDHLIFIITNTIFTTTTTTTTTSTTTTTTTHTTDTSITIINYLNGCQ